MPSDCSMMGVSTRGRRQMKRILVMIYSVASSRLYPADAAAPFVMTRQHFMLRQQANVSSDAVNFCIAAICTGMDFCGVTGSG